MQRALAGLALSLLAACATAPRAPAADTNDTPAARVAAMMQGHYDSRDQAARDADYHAISLVMVPIWPTRTDGHWLYVEQAMADKPAEPYRQRVYRVAGGADGAVVSEVYTLAEPKVYVQGWRTGALARLEHKALAPRTGCAVHLRAQVEGWTGATRGKACASERSGAAYATAEVQLDGARLTSWDRGFDAADGQAWGATKGPYVFIKRRAADAP